MHVALMVACTLVAGQLTATASFNTTFLPWTIMGPVTTNGTGHVVVDYTGGVLNYSVSLYNVDRVRNVELHIGDPGTHGDVIAVLFAAAFPSQGGTTNGLICAGTLEATDLVGPLLLPMGNHLEVSDLFDRYIQRGYASVIVHTLKNPGGELAALLNAADVNNMSPGMPPGVVGHG